MKNVVLVARKKCTGLFVPTMSDWDISGSVPKDALESAPQENTWFEDSRLSIEKSILMVYLFASRCSAKKAVEESSIDRFLIYQ